MMKPPLYDTRKTLAAACGLSLQRIDHHAAAGAFRLNNAKTRIPGVGVVFKAGLAERFIAAIRARHGHRIGKTESDAGTVKIQLTREDAQRLVEALTAALSAERKKPGDRWTAGFRCGGEHPAGTLDFAQASLSLGHEPVRSEIALHFADRRGDWLGNQRAAGVERRS